MAINLIESWTVNLAQVFVKFEPSVKISTIVNENITLEIGDATPSVSANPFELIDLAYDYNSVSKVLTLKWKPNVLQPETHYRIVFKNFRTSSNILISEDDIEFTTDVDVTPDPDDIPPPIPEVQIIDHTLIFDASGNVTSGGGNSADPDAFRVIDSDPVNFDAFLPEDYNNGVVMIKLNYRPKPEHLTNFYIKAQRKPIQRRPSRWEDLPIQIIAPGGNPQTIFINMPSTDDTPVYDTADKVYFESNYQYRIKLSKEIGTY